MAKLLRLPARDASGHVQVVIEAPRGSHVKLKYDAERKIFRWERALPNGWYYPCDWGFVPGTLGEDGDPLDVGVLFASSTWPGVVIVTRPIGLLRVRQTLPGAGEAEQNDRLIAVPEQGNEVRHVNDIDPSLRGTLEQFFVVSGEQTGKRIELQGWGGPDAARRALDEAAERFAKRRARRSRG